MARLGKIILILLIVAAAYFIIAKPQVPIPFGGNSGKLAEIDSKYGVGAGSIAPPRAQDIEAYEMELRKIFSANEAEKSLIAMKIELAEMQKYTFISASSTSRIDFQGIECSAAGPIGMAASSAGEAINHADKALEFQKKIGGVGSQEYLASGQTASTITFVRNALAEQKKNLDYLCGKGRK